MLAKNITSLLIVLLLLSYATEKATASPPKDVNSAIMSNKEMNKVNYHFLSSAEKGQTKYTFTNDNIANYHIINELIEAGYLYGPDQGLSGSLSYNGNSDEISGAEVRGVRITLSGREYLERLRSKQFCPSAWRLFWKGLFWVITIALSAIIAKQTEKMIDKRSLLKSKQLK